MIEWYWALGILFIGYGLGLLTIGILFSIREGSDD